MQSYWDDTPSYDRTPRPPRPETEHSCNGTATSCSPPPEFEDGVTIPFLKLRGRWLRDMGFTTGAKLKIDAQDGIITLTLLDNPKLPRPGVPRTLQREIHHTMVEADRLPICPNGALL